MRCRARIPAHAENTPSTLRIGHQKSSTLKTRGTLEQSLAPLGLRVSRHEFASGLPLTEPLNVGAVDFSADVPDTAPVFAQAAHARFVFVYVAQQAPSPKAQAIIAKRDSALPTLGQSQEQAHRRHKGCRQPLPGACRPRTHKACPQRRGNPLPDTGGRPRNVRTRKRRCMDHAGSLHRIGRRESRRANSAASQNFGEQQNIADTFRAVASLPARGDTAESLRWNFAAKRAVPIGA